MIGRKTQRFFEREDRRRIVRIMMLRGQAAIGIVESKIAIAQVLPAGLGARLLAWAVAALDLPPNLREDTVGPRDAPDRARFTNRTRVGDGESTAIDGP